MTLKRFFKLMTKAVFERTMENVVKQIDIKLFTIERKSNYLVPEPNYHTTKFFTEHLLVIEMKTQKYLQINLCISDFQY